MFHNEIDSESLTSPVNGPIHSNTGGDRTLSGYDYDLPSERIAQNPVIPRDNSRLLVVDSPTSHQHRRFRNLPELLEPGDLLVLNNTRVMAARLHGYKSTGAPVEVLLLEDQGDNQWLGLVKPGRRLKPGALIQFPAPENPEGKPGSNSTLQAKVLAIDEATGGRILQFEATPGASVRELLEAYGQVPLPPYITQSVASPDQYQTVYAEQSGSAAAPTAGLHFTEELLDRLEAKGINRAFVTLHVGVGTFRPVEVEDVTRHQMHQEWVQVPDETVEKIRETKARGGRVIAVGTTGVRSLEGAAVTGELQPFCGKTDLFIYPGYQWRVVDGLITNFHLPRSSLLMLVSALVGRDRLLGLYQEAIDHEYRFYSFGDAMIILPSAKTETSAS
ncbi:tRNA preQ1(34) S-adenosylmethionine ribosyltransferase-isomerase QueA [Phormidium pseudopriestleyi FRX01]|uniref:S-adenosylmethionine:tRNA ribosyltransferase-isomerase n=1 Tax=Phormidium pseudopriestleyi FRX01 TaxID=1759528 RepID=A0ABS3FVX2_9CYAN|nr:tRNA preQ1(34) S-adenosylmethionine ribosyltransferase-isomerase QueA [Phormidium pseudopriestleyi]MBO0351265.1 tRNA preQ1(34) S-adenosylmethionine ribosyltransferase-isomerase QueA [Phormidium pseudopriestleyi FRX01]